MQPGPTSTPTSTSTPDDDRTVRVEHLTKTFGSGPHAVRAVDDLNFEVRPGRVTGFLGPNGAGKTTTLRMLLGLVSPTSGTATVGGRRYAEIARPAHVVGAALEAASFHPGRTARDHLRVFAPQVGVPDTRADEVLALVGLSAVAQRRVGGFSLGMRQRLALATTLLGDPPVLLLDEPANGLDPEGIAWLRGFLRALAHEGRTVLVSSHVLSEVEQTVDDVVIIARGRLVHASPLGELARLARRRVEVASPDAAALDALVAAGGWAVDDVRRGPDGATYVLLDVDTPAVGAAAFGAGVELHRLQARDVGLEDVFLQLTAPPPGAEQPPAGAPAPARLDGAA
ncbi:ABC transporter ATP-binding protein [Cellulomonas uda]|uniref:ABC transporter ATP-binding protein n=1 Tax=Cellulomonas uda TaxID=1714 RepID=A0A4Y3KGS7_CELUD|nr:ABC transporter ATP-binding protein [Cellulomonas uda]NII66845.1 ABC-2 type transport system ATP-binding protein [Cellulomonas uda]GEA82140.1 ABC transporter ATP-binding protein [Cellulomonas uda]